MANYFSISGFSIFDDRLEWIKALRGLHIREKEYVKTNMLVVEHDSWYLINKEVKQF